MSKIFEEALADAKKLKELAEENAQKAILESVTPQIKQFIEKTLLEQDNDPDTTDEDSNSDDDSDESVVLDEAAVRSLVKMIGAENIYKNMKQKNTINEAFGTALNNLGGKDRLRMIQLIKKINQNKNILNNNDIINDQTNSVKESMNMRNREKMYEVDLSLLRESVNDRMFELAEKEDEKEKEDQEKKNEMNDFGDDLNLGEMMAGGVGTEVDEMSDFDMDSMEELGDMYSEEDHDTAQLVKELNYLMEQEEAEDVDMGEAEEAGGEMLAKDEVEAQIEELIADLGLDIGGGAGAGAGAEEGEGLGALEDIDIESEEPSEDASEEEGPVNEVFDIDPRVLRQELRNVRSLIREGNVDHHFGGKGSGKTNHSNAFGGAGPKKHGYQKSFGGGAYGKDPFVNPPQLNKLNEAIRKLRRMNRSQSEKLNKYRGAVQTLREQLEDLNLFNAKLLYVNKLLQNKYLSESQKKSVIKALDEAKSLGETKALYKSLTESLSRSKTLNESTRFGSSSRATTSGSGAKQTIGESNRWAKLAGLK